MQRAPGTAVPACRAPVPVVSRVRVPPRPAPGLPQPTGCGGAGPGLRFPAAPARPWRGVAAAEGGAAAGWGRGRLQSPGAGAGAQSARSAGPSAAQRGAQSASSPRVDGPGGWTGAAAALLAPRRRP